MEVFSYSTVISNDSAYILRTLEAIDLNTSGSRVLGLHVILNSHTKGRRHRLHGKKSKVAQTTTN